MEVYPHLWVTKVPGKTHVSNSALIALLQDLEQVP